jgi:hypothetical protein
VGGNVGINEVVPEASLDVAGDMKLGTSGMIFSQIQEFTGTTGTGHFVTVSYPSGFDMNNTRVLSLEIYFSNAYWASMGTTLATDPTWKTSCLLGSSQIFIYYPDDGGMHSKPFRMVLMKTGAAKDTEIQLTESQAFGSSDE